MSSRKRHELIGYFPDWPVPIEQGAAVGYPRGFVGVDKYTSATGYFTREQDVYRALEIVALRHLEIPGAPDAGPWIEKGFDCALHYFLEDWRTDQDPKGRNMLFAKRKRVNHVTWYDAFSRALILGLLSERWDDVARLCSWPWATLVPDYSGMGSDLEDEVAQMYIVVAAGLRDEPMDGLDKLKAKIRKCRTKRPRLLMKLWDAVESRDQSAFEDALDKSLAHHASGKRLDNRDGMIAERLALPQTAMYLTAMRYGLKPPELPEERSVYLITRQSLGLDS